MITDLLAGALTMGRSSDPSDTAIRNNMLSIYIAPSFYDRDEQVPAEVRRFVDWVKASPPLDATQPVLAPGEIERTTRAFAPLSRRFRTLLLHRVDIARYLDQKFVSRVFRRHICFIQTLDHAFTIQQPLHPKTIGAALVQETRRIFAVEVDQVTIGDDA